MLVSILLQHTKENNDPARGREGDFWEQKRFADVACPL